MNRRVAIWKDPEFYFILFYNIGIVVLYLTGKVEPMFVIWAYLLQSVFMGAQYVVHSYINKVRETGKLFPLRKLGMTGFFMMHYGGFHVVYVIFLFVMTAQIEDIDVVVDMFKYIRYTALFLLVNLFLYAGREIMPSAPNRIQPSMILAYLRILPMHIVIILGLNSKFVLDSFIIFMILKLIFDIILFLFTGGEAREYSEEELADARAKVEARLKEWEKQEKGQA
ncbi:MAG: hypothetical protein JXR19_01870 [Bacteroidia bacterium]